MYLRHCSKREKRKKDTAVPSTCCAELDMKRNPKFIESPGSFHSISRQIILGSDGTNVAMGHFIAIPKARYTTGFPKMALWWPPFILIKTYVNTNWFYKRFAIQFGEILPSFARERTFHKRLWRKTLETVNILISLWNIQIYKYLTWAAPH